MIQKRNGRQEFLDITKIQKHTISATENLEGVSQSELEIDAQIKFIDGMSTSDIQDALLKTDVEQIKELKKQLRLQISKNISRIKLIKSIIINSIINFTYSNLNAINLLFLSNIFGNNSSEEPHKN